MPSSILWLKKLLTSSSVLGFQYSVVAVLSQVQGDNEPIIAYMSKSSDEHE